MNYRAPTYDEFLDSTRRKTRQIDELRAEVERLKAESDPAKHAGKSQAAPFSQGSPKPFGRKARHPPGHRAASPPERVDRTIEVHLPADCPEFHAPLDEAPVTVYDQYQIDLAEPKPVITRFHIAVARCRACYRRVQGCYPNETSAALGAAAVQYGPRLFGFAADLKHRLGVSYCKCSSVPLTLAGLVVASAALVRNGHRLRWLAQPTHDRSVEASRHKCSPNY